MCSNIEGDFLKRLEFFAEFQDMLKPANTLLHQAYYRDRVRELFKNQPTEWLFKHFEGGNLIAWRWGSLLDVCRALHKREGALRTGWSLRKFLRIARSSTDGPEGAADGDVGTSRGKKTQLSDGDHKTFKAADSAWTSRYFWSYLKFILLLGGIVDDLSTWGEACPCHAWSKQGCPLRGRRAPECATGAFDTFLQGVLATASSLFVACAAGLGHGSPEWVQLNRDWHTAVDVISTELRAKTSHWKELPWLLCGIAFPESDRARSVARAAIAKYDNPDRVDPLTVYARRHRMTQRFLKSDYESHDDADVPLRGLLESFIQGSILDDEDMKPLREALGALRLVRVVERSTEDPWRIDCVDLSDD
ncbi:unnamed protein product [Symbiodinium sp. KB8]|nr:unnamed protein product [Symbiodinium sp. KB8]